MIYLPISRFLQIAVRMRDNKCQSAMKTDRCKQLDVYPQHVSFTTLRRCLLLLARGTSTLTLERVTCVFSARQRSSRVYYLRLFDSHDVSRRKRIRKDYTDKHAYTHTHRYVTYLLLHTCMRRCLQELFFKRSTMIIIFFISKQKFLRITARSLRYRSRGKERKKINK